MALATRCPQCQALFRVVADQLKLRGGLVRCGSCRHVFDAIGSLTYVDDNAVVQSEPTAATAARTVAPEKRAEAGPLAATPSARHRSADRSAGELGVPTLLITDLPAALTPSTPEPAVAAEAPPTAAPAAAELAEREARRARRRQRRREAEAAQADEARDRIGPATVVEGDEAPEFLRSERGRHGFSVVFGGGSLLLALLMLAQLAVIYRVDLSTHVPSLRPALVQLCRPLDCTVGWPTRADLLAVVGTELQAVPGTDLLELTAVIRNRADFHVALPAIEVALTDTQNRTLARKVFAPVDYLASSGQPSSRIDDGLAAGADYEVRIHFEARGINAAGFVVYPFYL